MLHAFSGMERIPMVNFSSGFGAGLDLGLTGIADGEIGNSQLTATTVDKKKKKPPAGVGDPSNPMPTSASSMALLSGLGDSIFGPFR